MRETEVVKDWSEAVSHGHDRTCTHELVASVNDCTRPLQDQVTEHSTMNGGGTLVPQPLAEELLRMLIAAKGGRASFL